MNVREGQNLDRVNDRLGGVLRDYFQSEVPQPWPAWNPPATARLPQRNRARWVLAASIALLVAGTWFIAGRTPPEASGSGKGVEVGNRERPWVTAPAEKPAMH